MSENTPIQRQVQLYIRVFAALAALTVITVGASYLKLPLMIAILVALFIASVKGSLVASFFMHLVGERRIIFTILLFASIFFLALLLLPTLSRL